MLKRVELKTGWPSGLRRWIKAPISSGAWVRIPLQSNIFYLISFQSYAKSEAKKLSKSLKSFPGVVGVSIEYSGKAPSGMTGGAIFGVIVLVVLVPIVVGFVYVKRDSLPSFSAFTK